MMKKLLALLLLFCGIASVASADVPSWEEMRSRRAENAAESLEETGLRISGLVCVLEKDVSLSFMLDNYPGGTLYASLKDEEGKELFSQEQVVEEQKMESSKITVGPLTCLQEKGTYNLLLELKYVMEYDKLTRLGGGLEWFKAGSPMLREHKKVEKSLTRPLKIIRTSHRCYMIR